MLPFEALTAAEEAATTCDIFFSVGTSAEVYPAANLPIIAKRSGAFVVEVNPKTTAISHYMDVCLKAPSGEALPELLKEFEKFKMEHSK
jgi:NAD-dependent deacetylase